MIEIGVIVLANDDELRVINPNIKKEVAVDVRDAHINCIKNSTGNKKFKKSNLKRKVIKAGAVALVGMAFINVAIHAKNVLLGKKIIIETARDTGTFDDLYFYSDGIRISGTRVNDEGDVFTTQDSITDEQAMEIIRAGLVDDGLSNVGNYIAVSNLANSELACEMYGNVTLGQIIAEEEVSYYNNYVLSEVNSKGAKR